MTKTEATSAARAFVNAFVKTNRQWGVNSVAACLPSGWTLSHRATEDDFMPATVANVAAAVRRLATKAT